MTENFWEHVRSTTDLTAWSVIGPKLPIYYGHDI